MYLNENIKLKKYPRFHREPIMPRVGRDMKDWLIFFFIYIYIYIYETTLDQINKQHMLASALYIFPKSQLNRGFICENKVCEGAFYESGSS